MEGVISRMKKMLEYSLVKKFVDFYGISFFIISSNLNYLIMEFRFNINITNSITKVTIIVLCKLDA